MSMAPSAELFCFGFDALSDRQLLIVMYNKLTQLEDTVTELAQAVDSLKSSITDLADTVNGQVEPLQAALDAALQKLADFDAADTAEDADREAAFATLQSELQSQVEDAKAAADNIQGAVAQIQTVRQQIDDAIPDDGGTPDGGDQGGGDTGPTGGDTGPTTPDGGDTGATAPDAGGDGSTGGDGGDTPGGPDDGGPTGPDTGPTVPDTGDTGSTGATGDDSPPM